MANYSYKAIDPGGNITEGTLEANDQTMAIAKLKELKLSPVSISQASAKSSKKKLFGSKNITKSDISNFTTRLAALLKAKMPLAKALHSLERQSDKETLKKLIGDIYTKVLEGIPLSDAFAAYPKYFNTLYINLVKVGEVGGVLDDSLKRVADIRKRDQIMISKLKSAMTYPIVMCIIMLGSIGVLVGFVVPNFVNAFGDMGIVLPLPTRILIALSNFFGKWWWVVLIIIVLLIIAFINFKKKEQGRLAFDKFKLQLPLIGKLIHEVSLSRFTLSLGSLVSSGVSLVQALEATANITGNVYISNSLESLITEVKEGEPLSATFKKRPFFFPNLAVEMTQTGEETGNLDEMLENLGNYYLEESDKKIAFVSTLMEPAIIVIMGVVVGFIVMAMMLPIFDISTSLH
jgi:type IV pilus assembly protein PilC